jgi:molybdopterin synthase sulfur carrier subunit
MWVAVSGPLRDAVGGAASIEIEAATIRELMGKLVERYPRIQRHLDAGIAVAINGDIFRDEWSTAIPAAAEVVLMPRIQGG